LSITITDTDHGYDALAKRLKDLVGERRSVVVGIRQGEGGKHVKTVGDPGSRRSVVGGPSDPTLAQIAAKNEFGDRSSGVPERSFLRSTFDLNLRKYEKQTAKGLGRVADGKEDIDTVLGLIGTGMVNDVQDAILAIRSPANSKATVEAKGSSNPLIDTGHMRQSIDYEVR